MVEEKDTCQGQSCPCSRGYHRDNGLDGYVKKVVDNLLLLNDEQRDLLALILRCKRRA